MAKPLLFGDGAMGGSLGADQIAKIREIEDVWDRSYVPGYGELRRDNEWRVRDGKKPIPHDRLQWIRIGRTDGTSVGDRDMLDWALNGYQFISKKELEDRGWEMPPTAYEDTQGRVRREDLALAFVDAAQAEANRVRQDQITAEFHQGRAYSPSADNPEIAWDERKDEKGSLAEITQRHGPRD